MISIVPVYAISPIPIKKFSAGNSCASLSTTVINCSVAISGGVTAGYTLVINTEYENANGGGAKDCTASNWNLPTMSSVSITDTLGNTYTAVAPQVNSPYGNPWTVQIFSTRILSTAADTVTVRFTSGTYCGVQSASFAGQEISGIISGVQSTTGSSATLDCSTSCTMQTHSTPFNTNSYLDAVTACNISGAPSYTAGTGFTLTQISGSGMATWAYENSTDTSISTATTFLMHIATGSVGTLCAEQAAVFGMTPNPSNPGSMGSCNIICAIVNQMVLYIAILVPCLAVIILVTRIFNAMNFTGIGMLIGLSLALMGLSFWGLIPWYITALVTGISIYTLISGRRQQNANP